MWRFARVCAIAMAAVLLGCGSGGSEAPSMYDDPRQYELRELPRLGFLKPGTALLVGRFRSSPPTHALFLRDGEQSSRVKGPADLAGYVTIDSHADALQYARLFSSLVIPAKVSDTQWREVLRVSALSQELFFGSDAFHNRTPEDVTYWDERGRPGWRVFGIMLDEEWEANGLSEPSVTQSEGSFVVTTWLWTSDEEMGSRLRGVHRESDVVHLVARTIAADGTITEEVLEKKELEGIVLVTIQRRF